MLHSSIYIPILILFLSDNSLANISGTYKPMHAIENKTRQNNSSNTCCWTGWLVIPWSHFSNERGYPCFGDFSMGPFPIPFPLTPKYLIPSECFPIPFPLPGCFALAQALYSTFFFFWKVSELIIRCFNLPCMTWSQAGGFSANTIPTVKSVKFPTFPSNNNDYDPSLIRCPQITTPSPLLMEVHMVSFCPHYPDCYVAIENFPMGSY